MRAKIKKVADNPNIYRIYTQEDYDSPDLWMPLMDVEAIDSHTARAVAIYEFSCLMSKAHVELG